jgi:hypothetical protein
MGAITFGIPKELVKNLQTIFQIEDFIETGTFKGKTTSWAAKNFKNVFTVEYSKVIFEAAVKSLSIYPNIRCFFGSSPERLPEILSQLNSPAIFWLDAHWCGGTTYGISDECPLLNEIELVLKHPEKHIILIDDARLFLKPPSKHHSGDQWPGLDEIVGLLSKRPGFYTFTCEDVIVSIPIDGQDKLQSYFSRIHETEFPGGGIFSNLKFAARNIIRKWS